uniref:Putative secreted protein n=1 Tax=Anopheles marajoara TaxID=58244 RepID=A0A2M4CFW9_9DIPT
MEFLLFVLVVSQFHAIIRLSVTKCNYPHALNGQQKCGHAAFFFFLFRTQNSICFALAHLLAHTYTP